MQTIATAQAPAAIGPYAQAIRAGNLIYCSGQLPLDPVTSQFVPGGAAEQTRRVLQNLAAVLAAGGSSLARVVKTTVYLKDLQDFAAMNAEYAAAFGTHAPARATVQVARLPKDALVEIDCIAIVDAA